MLEILQTITVSDETMGQESKLLKTDLLFQKWQSYYAAKSSSFRSLMELNIAHSLINKSDSSMNYRSEASELQAFQKLFE